MHGQHAQPAARERVDTATTRLSDVDGEAGELLIAGYPVGEIASRASFEDTTWLLWHGALPNAAQREAFRVDLAARRTLAPQTVALLRECARMRLDPLDALRMGLGTVPTLADDPISIVALVPGIVAAFERLSRREEPLAARADLGHAANYLYMLSGVVPAPEQVRALETYLNTVVDHGLSASTFTCRVIASTGSDLTSAVVGAIGALKGPRHGGAPRSTLGTVFEVGEESRAEQVLRDKLLAGERLLGFGHEVYEVRDPRADVLAAATERLLAGTGDRHLYALARMVERTALRLLHEQVPDPRLRTNVEFYTALLLHGLGLDVTVFTPTFAVARVSGWLAHAAEQRATNRLIRPHAEYVGPRGRRWSAPEAGAADEARHPTDARPLAFLSG